ncbi:hypothetical protein OAK65_02690 [Synechococcus sp. AH-551-N17]|nr:hypothetical protein [Synechococcus sp. AH-551-N17]
MIPNLSRAYSVLISNTWTEIKSAEPSELAGWITLEMPSNFMRISVREDSISAVRYRELPDQQERPINTPWKN